MDQSNLLLSYEDGDSGNGIDIDIGNGIDIGVINIRLFND
jgi:hypothetical protein